MKSDQRGYTDNTHVKGGSIVLVFREMQVEATMRYHCTPIKMAEMIIIKKRIKQFQHQMLARMQRNGITHTWLVGM